ncbi:MAG: hypothetical protein GY807_23350, partial [Gammaproteobacteria bacterium]|nr:hypothetical protein [Gammaproteobacteria bacterium]
MAEQQLQIYNPNNGEWREVKGITSVLPAGEGFDYIRGDGAAFSSAYSKSDYPLTPIDPPIWATLGKNALATVPEEERENVTGEFRKPSAERGLTPDNIAPCYYGDHVTHIGPRI